MLMLLKCQRLRKGHLLLICPRCRHSYCRNDPPPTPSRPSFHAGASSARLWPAPPRACPRQTSTACAHQQYVPPVPPSRPPAPRAGAGVPPPPPARGMPRPPGAWPCWPPLCPPWWDAARRAPSPRGTSLSMLAGCRRDQRRRRPRSSSRWVRKLAGSCSRMRHLQMTRRCLLGRQAAAVSVVVVVWCNTTARAPRQCWGLCSSMVTAVLLRCSSGSEGHPYSTSRCVQSRGDA